MSIEEIAGRADAEVGGLLREVAGWLAAEWPDLEASPKTGWGTVNYHHAKAGFVLALYPDRGQLSVIFQQGQLLSSPLLTGKTRSGSTTRQVRWVPLRPGEPVPWDEIGILIVEAIALRA